MMGTGEIKNEKAYASPRPPPKISFKDNWMKELGSEVAGSSEDSQLTQPKTKNPFGRTGRPVFQLCASVCRTCRERQRRTQKRRRRSC